VRRALKAVESAAEITPSHETADGGPVRAETPHHTILGFEVSGGFLGGLELELVDGLNCIIGGRGTGKTTLLELIRYALAADGRSTPARQKVVQSNLGTGRVRVKVRTKLGAVYYADRPWNDTCQVLDAEGQPTTLSLDRDLFRADIYSQNEIEEIATSPEAQLALIDKFREEELRRLDGEVRRLTGELEKNAAELLGLDRAVADLGEANQEARTLEEKLKALKQTGGADAEVVNRAHQDKALRERERRAVECLRTDVRRMGAELAAQARTMGQRVSTRLDADFSQGPNRDAFGRIGELVGDLLTALERVTAEAGQRAETFAAELTQEEQSLAEAHAHQEHAYRELVAAQNEEQGRAQARSQLQKQLVSVTHAATELQSRVKDRAGKESERNQMLARLSDLRRDRYALRKGIADHLSATLGPSVRVSVTQSNDRDAYRALVSVALGRSGLRDLGQTVERVTQAIPPQMLARAAQRGDADSLVERVGLSAKNAGRVVELLRESGAMYALEVVELSDVPRIELLDGADYKLAPDLSTGQRCTAILSILLLDSERPLLVDQPEDNLDNAFIYSTVVRSLLGTKGKRQLIFISHNPNVPTLGWAERVFVMGSDGRHGTVVQQGSVDECREHIETILEGGREAFLLRKERYGL